MRIGLTGGIAAGKSTVSARLAELGACVIDYDMLARKVVEPGGAALPRIVETFGGQVLRADGTLVRGLPSMYSAPSPNSDRANAWTA